MKPFEKSVVSKNLNCYRKCHTLLFVLTFNDISNILLQEKKKQSQKKNKNNNKLTEFAMDSSRFRTNFLLFEFPRSVRHTLNCLIWFIINDCGSRLERSERLQMIFYTLKQTSPHLQNDRSTFGFQYETKLKAYKIYFIIKDLICFAFGLFIINITT